MPVAASDHRLEPVNFAQESDMDGKRTLTIITVAALGLATACGGSATPAPSGGTAAPGTIAAPSSAAAATSGITTKGGGVAATLLKARLITGDGEGIDENVFADAVRSRSNGSIDVSVATGWRSGDPNYEAGVITDVIKGQADLAVVGARAFDLVGINSFQGLVAPFAIDSYGLESEVLNSDWAMKLLDATKPMGIVGLDYIAGPLRQPLGLTRDLVGPDDYRGARIGIRPGHVAEMTFQALGAVAVPFVASHMAGLDGIESHIDTIAGSKYDVGAKSLTGNVVLFARPTVVVANEAWFNGLSADQQAVLRQAATDTKQHTEATVPVTAAIAAQTVCSRGLVIRNASADQRDLLHDAVVPTIEKLAHDSTNRVTLAAIAALRGTRGPDVLAPCDVAAASAPPSAAATAIDGTWTTSFTLADLQASPLLIDTGELNNENWGDMVLTMANGQITVSQKNALTSTSTAGTFKVDGDAITMHFVEGANAGETFGFHWSLFKNTLTLSRDPALNLPGPTPLLLKAWTKTR